ncbi:c-type cytochrome [Polymorphobacter sp.]|uniref:c-type cytochrome n=1 Tax=Polymorphobacter sp. TaxID=1909290 RepID=UPI003F6FC9B5
MMLALLLAAAPLSVGERAFLKCYSCHSVVAGEDGLQGPNLRGVIGRRAGTLAGFDYSPAMKAADIVWDRVRLDAFLQAPDSVVPGTAMTRPPLASDEERRAVIDYLENPE